MVATGSCLCLHNTRPRPANHSWKWATIWGGSSHWAAYCKIGQSEVSIDKSTHITQNLVFLFFLHSLRDLYFNHILFSSAARSCADYLLSWLLYTAETFNSSAAHPQHFLGNSYHYSLTSPRSQAVRKPKSTASLASRSNQGTPISQSSHNSLFQVSRDHAVNPTSIRITYGLPSMSHRPK